MEESHLHILYTINAGPFDSPYEYLAVNLVYVLKEDQVLRYCIHPVLSLLSFQTQNCIINT